MTRDKTRRCTVHLMMHQARLELIILHYCCIILLHISQKTYGMLTIVINMYSEKKFIIPGKIFLLNEEHNNYIKNLVLIVLENYTCFNVIVKCMLLLFRKGCFKEQ